MQAGQTWRTRDGWMLSIRPIGPGDEARWTAFVQGLSPATRYKRGGTRLEDLTPALARKRVTPDLEREFALVAVASNADGSSIVGVARCVRHDRDRWEFMLVVADKWQRRGVGRRLMGELDAEISRRVRRHWRGSYSPPTAGCSTSCSAWASTSSRARPRRCSVAW